MHLEEISLVSLNHRVDVGLSHSRIDHEGRVGGRTIRGISPRGRSERVGEREEREVPPDVVRVRVHPDDVFETTVVDLEVVLGITPAANAVGRGIKEGGMLKVSRI